MAAILISKRQAKDLGLNVHKGKYDVAFTLLQIGKSKSRSVFVCLETKEFIVRNDGVCHHGYPLKETTIVIPTLEALCLYTQDQSMFETGLEYKLEFTNTEIKITSNNNTVEFHQDDNWFDLFLENGIVNMLDIYEA